MTRSGPDQISEEAGCAKQPKTILSHSDHHRRASRTDARCGIWHLCARLLATNASYVVHIETSSKSQTALVRPVSRRMSSSIHRPGQWQLWTQRSYPSSAQDTQYGVIGTISGVLLGDVNLPATRCGLGVRKTTLELMTRNAPGPIRDLFRLLVWCIQQKPRDNL